MLPIVGNNAERSWGGESVLTNQLIFYFIIRFIYATLVKGTHLCTQLFLRQPRKERLERKSFTPNYGSDNQLFPLMNNVECFVSHKFGHVASRCRSRMVQANNHHT